MKAIATEIPKTNIKAKQVNNIVNKDKTKNSDTKNEKNINFLDLLLKDIKAKQVNNTEIENNNSKDKKNGITKEIQELLKELLLDKNKNISNEIPNLNAVLNKVNFNQDIVKEIKNIITTNLKQQNILLTKTEINQFKKINNVTDLVKFANKKKLNIQKLIFKIVKNLKENPKLPNNIKQSIKPFKYINNKNQSKISTSQIISTKKELANATPKINIPYKTNTKTNPKNIDKQISIKNIIQSNIKNNTNTNNNIKTSINKTTTIQDKKNGITKEIQELLKELLLDKNKNISNEIPNLNAVLNKVNFNQDIVKEIKNIITTNLKQQNILLTKTEINQFKKINNVTDLVKFANKKKLNIQKLIFKIVKNLKENPKLPNNIKQSIKPFKYINNKNQSKISTSQIISTKKELANATPKINIPYKTNTKTNPKNIDKQISIKNIIQSNIKNNTNTNNNIKTSINKTTQNNLVADKTTQLNNHHNTKTNTIKQINLNSLLNNTKEKAEKTISHNSQKKSIDLNTQINSDVNINEIKAKQVLAKNTINHFKNNLDEAIKNYKPPISKVNIELNPKNLGKVEVSIIQRGNNITLHMNTDQNNVILFQNHQAEFRQALSNIGFSNIDMNFNSNQEKEKRQNQAKKSYKNNSGDMDFSDIEIEANYKYA